jgi:hypothetical protein
VTERVYVEGGVTIPLSTIVEGSKAGVLSHLRNGLAEAETTLEAAGLAVTDARCEMERAEIAYVRAEAKATAWRNAHDAAKKAFGR